MPSQHRPDPAARGCDQHASEPAEQAVSEPDEQAGPGPGEQAGLSDRDRRILALESRTFRYVGAKERAIREEIGISRTAYYVRLNTLLDDPEALRAAPSVIHRLRGHRTSQDGPAGLSDTGRVA